MRVTKGSNVPQIEESGDGSNTRIKVTPTLRGEKNTRHREENSDECANVFLSSTNFTYNYQTQLSKYSVFSISGMRVWKHPFTIFYIYSTAAYYTVGVYWRWSLL